jgi:hypothetical protein
MKKRLKKIYPMIAPRYVRQFVAHDHASLCRVCPFDNVHRQQDQRASEAKQHWRSNFGRKPDAHAASARRFVFAVGTAQLLI